MLFTILFQEINTESLNIIFLKLRSLGCKTLLTFGGAYSNHIAAVASAGQIYGLKTIGVIRGEELIDKIDSNATLSYAKACGMQFKFVSREAYRNKTSIDFIKILKKNLETFIVFRKVVQIY